jgi:peptide/nickel transport system permease protein
VSATLTDAPVTTRRGARLGSFGRNSALVGASILGAIVLLALLAPVLPIPDPNAIDSSRVLARPDLQHPFGSDALGRDVLSRVIWAYRASLLVAVGSVLLALVVGIPLGLVAGHFRGWAETLIMRPVDLLLALPALLLAVALIAITGPGLAVAVIAIAIIYLPIVARVQRGSSLAASSEDYVEKARAHGASHLAVMRQHVLPNSLGPTLVQATVLMGFALQIEAALSFLGLGVQPPTPSLGRMLADGYQVLNQAPWADIFPGLAIAIAVIAFNLVGDGLRSRLDPRRISE